jgi:uroporphyrinogen decarboxylase
MRQAGRYHSHYQALRARYSFIELCKKPDVAAEVAMGPIQDFDFDAAILFSDLLFPLEAMGMGLDYPQGPELAWHIETLKDVDRLNGDPSAIEMLSFQAEAIRLTRRRLDPTKGMIGFVGGPLTLFFYAVEGSHAGALKSAKAGMTDGRYAAFCEKLIPLLARNIAMQAEAGPDCVAVLDTCGGELDSKQFGALAVPMIKRVIDEARKLAPGCRILYYSKNTGPDHWDELKKCPIQAMGVDWKNPMAPVLTGYSDQWALQGNFDPNLLFLEPKPFEKAVREFFEPIARLSAEHRRGWICGLGHGVLPKTPEANVRAFLRVQREVFGK